MVTVAVPALQEWLLLQSVRDAVVPAEAASCCSRGFSTSLSSTTKTSQRQKGEENPSGSQRSH